MVVHIFNLSIPDTGVCLNLRLAYVDLPLHSHFQDSQHYIDPVSKKKKP